ncbi:hypothetical protein [Nonomuraea sp. B1E8]|uniref:hypothetical protein n=1 Tax=unclassified Nonomuraea TaxID=2593643 RepID=UPI00325E7028
MSFRPAGGVMGGHLAWSAGMTGESYRARFMKLSTFGRNIRSARPRAGPHRIEFSAGAALAEAFSPGFHGTCAGTSYAIT